MELWLEAEGTQSGMKKHRVIIADSSQSFLEGIRGLLETEFDAVVMVADEGSLIDAAERLGADLVVIDLSLGLKREAYIVKKIKTLSPDIKIIILSALDEQPALDKAVSAGADGFVLKREAANDLIPAVRTVLGGQTYVSNLQKR